MNWTHDQYGDCECDPAAYNPAYQFHNPPSWLIAATSRDGYEAACHACGVAARSDEQIRHDAYGLEHAEYSLPDWQAMTREVRVTWKLDRVRLNGIEREDQVLRHTATLHAATGLGVQGPGGIYKPDASPTTRKCARCGRPAMWIAGAGEALCVTHQDDY